MKSKNIRLPLFLSTIQCGFTLIILVSLIFLLSEDLKSRVEAILELTKQLIIFFNSDRSVYWIYLNKEIHYVAHSLVFNFLLVIAFLLAVLLTSVIQIFITRIETTGKYKIAIFLYFSLVILSTSIFQQFDIALWGFYFGLIFAQPIAWYLIVREKNIRTQVSDIKDASSNLQKLKSFDPLRYINLHKGIFVGLTLEGKPHYISIGDFRKHLQILGETRSGKTVSALLLQAQATLLNETVVIFDPKNDRYAPNILKGLAERGNIPFVFINLNPDQPPQINPFGGCKPHEVEELLVTALDLNSKATDADHYRTADRASVRKIANNHISSIGDMINFGLMNEEIQETSGFWNSLQELASHAPIQTHRGWDLNEMICTPHVIYIVGSTSHENTIRIQKLLLLRILQIIGKKGLLTGSTWTSLYCDEFKYLLSSTSMKALGVVADRNCHLTVVHQSLGDLSDVTGLDKDAVWGAVVVNTGLKMVCKTLDPVTAKWASEMGGTVIGYRETFTKMDNSNSGLYQQVEVPFVHSNQILNLPKKSGFLFGAGPAIQVFVDFLPASDNPPQIMVAEPYEISITKAEII